MDGNGILLKSAIAETRAMLDRARNIKPHAPAIGRILEDNQRTVFDSAPATTASGAVFGGVTWDRLTENYLKANPHRQSGQQLTDTGELRNSFKIGDGNNIFEAGADYVLFGSSLDKAAGLQEKRPMLFAHEALNQRVVQSFEKYIAGKEHGSK